MNLFPAIVGCGVILSGCSMTPTASSISGIDRVQSGTETTWSNNLKLSVQKREGPRLEGVRVEQTLPDDSHFVYTAESAAIEPGSIDDPKAAEAFTVVIPNARTEAARGGLRLTNTENVRMVFSR